MKREPITINFARGCNEQSGIVIETGIEETIAIIDESKSKLYHKTIEDNDRKYGCEYCSLRDLNCNMILCGRDERSDKKDIHYELVKALNKQQIYYKTNEYCKYDCQGLCKDSC